MFTCAQNGAVQGRHDIPRDVMMLARMYQSPKYSWQDMAELLGRSWPSTRKFVKAMQVRYPRLFPKRDNLGNFLTEYDSV